MLHQKPLKGFAWTVRCALFNPKCLKASSSSRPSSCSSAAATRSCFRWSGGGPPASCWFRCWPIELCSLQIRFPWWRWCAGRLPTPLRSRLLFLLRGNRRLLRARCCWWWPRLLSCSDGSWCALRGGRCAWSVWDTPGTWTFSHLKKSE